MVDILVDWLNEMSIVAKDGWMLGSFVFRSAVRLEAVEGVSIATVV